MYTVDWQSQHLLELIAYNEWAEQIPEKADKEKKIHSNYVQSANDFISGDQQSDSSRKYLTITDRKLIKNE